MPGLDRTGPDGQGSGTGRKLGNCNPDNTGSRQQQLDDEYAFGPGKGRGMRNRRGYGAGRGRGFGNRLRRGPGH